MEFDIGESNMYIIVVGKYHYPLAIASVVVESRTHKKRFQSNQHFSICPCRVTRHLFPFLLVRSKQAAAYTVYAYQQTHIHQWIDTYFLCSRFSWSGFYTPCAMKLCYLEQQQHKK